MSVLYRVALLVLLVLQGSNAEECNDLTKRLQASAVDQILGKWVLVGAVADFPRGNALLVNLSSTHIDLHFNPDNKTISFTERNMFKSKSCMSYYSNLTVLDTEDSNLTLRADFFYLEQDGAVSVYNHSGRVDVYHSSPDCLIITWTFVYEGKPGNYLVSYRKEGKHQGEEALKAAEEHGRRAACLRLPDDGHFIYDAAAAPPSPAEFCPEKTAEEQTKDH